MHVGHFEARPRTPRAPGASMAKKARGDEEQEAGPRRAASSSEKPCSRLDVHAAFRVLTLTRRASPGARTPVVDAAAALRPPERVTSTRRTIVLLFRAWLGAARPTSAGRRAVPSGRRRANAAERPAELVDEVAVAVGVGARRGPPGTRAQAPLPPAAGLPARPPVSVVVSVAGKTRGRRSPTSGRASCSISAARALEA